eukprot:1160639-Pelagomonas_calceolata.AAC.1
MNQADFLGLAKHVLLQLSCPDRQQRAAAAAAAAWGLVWASRGLRNAAGPVAGGVHGTLEEWCRQRRRWAKRRAKAWEAWMNKASGGWCLLA